MTRPPNRSTLLVVHIAESPLLSSNTIRMLTFLSTQSFHGDIHISVVRGGRTRCNAAPFVFTGCCGHEGIVPAQRVEEIHTWTKEGRLNKSKTPNDIFDALIVIVGELILKWKWLESGVTTSCFCARHYTTQNIFPCRMRPGSTG